MFNRSASKLAGPPLDQRLQALRQTDLDLVRGQVQPRPAFDNGFDNSFANVFDNGFDNSFNADTLHQDGLPTAVAPDNR